MASKYKHFFFDLDDTLLNFKESERLSFSSTMKELGIKQNLPDIFSEYQNINQKLWTLLEKGKVAKEDLKLQRFKELFLKFEIDIDPVKASKLYLEALPESVVLMENAIETLEYANSHAEVGIITNGMESVQLQRINNSPLKHLIHFVCVSDSAGYAKPDIRFFEYTAKHATNFKKETALVIGDRYEADILGAHKFGVDSCWLNTDGKKTDLTLHTYELSNLKELETSLTMNIQS